MDMRDDKQAKILACRRLIDADPVNAPPPEALAGRFGFAYPTFRRLFTSLCSCSVYQYIRLRRVERAARELRESGSVPKAMALGGFQTASGFGKAFTAVYGVSYAKYAETRGSILMKEPQRTERPGFYLAGQIYPVGAAGDTDGKTEIPELPGAALEELERSLRLGATLFGTRISWEPSADYYLLGVPLPDPRMTPEGQTGNMMPGGLFLVFPLPEDPEPLRFEEKRRAVWFYACTSGSMPSGSIFPIHLMRWIGGERHMNVITDSAGRSPCPWRKPSILPARPTDERRAKCPRFRSAHNSDHFGVFCGLN